MKKSSFSEETKLELSDSMPKNQCCRKSLFYGLLCVSRITDREDVVFETESLVVIELVKKLGFELFGMKDEIEIVVVNRKRKYRLPITRKKVKEAILNIRLSEEKIEDLLETPKYHCISAFARGVFLCSGTITNPKNSYHIEFSFLDEKLLDKFEILLQDNAIYPKKIMRKRGPSLYCKESAAIEDFIALIGANKAMFEIMNSKIEREIRNNSNRVANCEANNIAKSVSASGKHIEAIEKLIDMDRLSSLPEELKETAELRIKYKDLSLADLGAMMSPPISKSGINHRLNKIIEISNKM